MVAVRIQPDARVIGRSAEWRCPLPAELRDIPENGVMTEDEFEKPSDGRAAVPGDPSTAEPALRESESRFRTILATLKEGFCISDRLPGEPIDFRYVIANQAFQHQSGISGDPVGKTMRELVPTVD